MALSSLARAIAAALSIAIVGILAACNATSTTSVDSTNYFTFTADPALADSIVVQAGSVIPVRVKITHDGAAASYIGIAWSTTGGSRVADTTATTDSLGYAFAHWVVSDTIGTNTVTLTTLAGTHTFSARTIPGAASNILRVGTDSMNVAVAAATTLGVQVVDARGNAVSGAVIQWAANAGTLNGASSTSDTAGRAQIAFIAPSAGRYTVTATLPDRATISFTIVAQ